MNHTAPGQNNGPPRFVVRAGAVPARCRGAIVAILPSPITIMLMGGPIFALLVIGYRIGGTPTIWDVFTGAVFLLVQWAADRRKVRNSEEMVDREWSVRCGTCTGRVGDRRPTCPISPTSPVGTCARGPAPRRRPLA